MSREHTWNLSKWGQGKMKHEKPELSRKNPYRLPKYRYLELKNFCFQYNDWKRALARLDGWRAQEGDMGGIVKSNIPSDPTAREGMRHPTALQRGNQSDLLGTYRPVADRQNLSAHRIQGVFWCSRKEEGLARVLSDGHCPTAHVGAADETAQERTLGDQLWPCTDLRAFIFSLDFDII